jgi:hypothetical protein
LLLNYENPIATLYIWSLYESDDPRLVWHVEIRPNISQWWYYFVDAQTGEVLEKYNNAQADGPVTGSGIDLFGVNRTLNLYQGPSQYYMIDASRPMWPSDPPPIWLTPHKRVLILSEEVFDEQFKTPVHGGV